MTADAREEVEKDIIEYIHSNLDGVKEDVSKLDMQILVHLEESQISLVSLVIKDLQNNEFKIRLSSFADGEYKETNIYVGQDEKVADQVAKSLLEAFDNADYGEFGIDGSFSM